MFIWKLIEAQAAQPEDIRGTTRKRCLHKMHPVSHKSVNKDIHMFLYQQPCHSVMKSELCATHLLF